MNRPRLESWLPWLLLGIGCCLLYGPYALGALPVGADHSLFYGPFFSLKWSGGPPLWNPYSLSGSPLVDNLQAAMLYPLRWPFYFIEDWRSYYGPFHFIHYLVALAGAVVLLRALGLGAWPALVGAFVYGGGGHMAGRIINPTIFYGCCWLPWLLAAAAGSRRRHHWLATLAAAMIFTIGSPHLMFYGFIGFGVVWLIQVGSPLWRERGPGPAAREATRSALHLALGFVLAMPTLIPGILRVTKSVRTHASVADNLADSLAWGELVPALLGGTLGGVYPEYIDKALYVGPVVLALIVTLLTGRAAWRDRRVWCGVALVLFGLWFALGKNAGIQFIMPWVPGFSKLAGPGRGLVLAALGLAVLTALALERFHLLSLKRWALVWLGLAAIGFMVFFTRSWQLNIPEGSAPYGDDWLIAWLLAPESLGRRLFLWVEAGVGLSLLGLVFFLGRRYRRLGFALTGLVVVMLLWHFKPRVAPPVEGTAFFNRPSQASYLKQRAAAQVEPFRIAGYDPLRLHDTEFLSLLKFQTFMPNLATFYGLEDINGFDPLITLNYLDLIERTAGRSPINDPYRNLTFARPDQKLFATLGLRYLIGNPHDRRLTTLPETLDGATPRRPVSAWDNAGTTAPVTHWLFLSTFDRPLRTPLEAEVARLRVEAEEGEFTFSVRNGIETAFARAPDLPVLFTHPRFVAVTNWLWATPAVVPSLGYQYQSANYRGSIDFGRALRVKRVTWELDDPRFRFVVLGQAYRLAPPPADVDPWRLVFGDADGPAPIFEFMNAQPRAFLAEAGESPREAATIEPLAGDIDRVRWLERGNHSMRLAVDAPKKCLLVLRELWTPGWRARVNGQSREVQRVADLLRAVQVPAGRSEVEVVYRPMLPALLLGFSLATLFAIIMGQIIMAVRRRKE